MLDLILEQVCESDHLLLDLSDQGAMHGQAACFALRAYGATQQTVSCWQVRQGSYNDTATQFLHSRSV